MTDARADVQIRLALLYHAFGQTSKSQECVRLCHDDRDRLRSLNALGCADRHVSEIAMWCGALADPARYADRAYAERTRADRPRLVINDAGALDQVMRMRAWSAFAGGDRIALARVLQDRTEENAPFADSFAAGFLAWDTMSPQEIKALVEQGSAMEMSRAYGIWAGATWTGNREYAVQLAERLVDAPGEWPAALHAFIRNEISIDALLSPAQPEVLRIELAWFTAAMKAETESERRARLESVLQLCHPNLPAACACWLLATLGQPPVRATCP